MAAEAHKPFVTVGDLREYLSKFPDKAIVHLTKADHVQPGSAVCLDVAMSHLEQQNTDRHL